MKHHLKRTLVWACACMLLAMLPITRLSYANTGYAFSSAQGPTLKNNVDAFDKALSFARSLETTYVNSNGESWLDLLPDCPCTTSEVVTHTSVPDPIHGSKLVDGPWTPAFLGDSQIWLNYFHPGGDDSYRFIGVDHPSITDPSRMPVSTIAGTEHSQQCIYDGEGYLINSGPAAGTPDIAQSPSGAHNEQDVDPFHVLGWQLYNRYWPPSLGESGCNQTTNTGGVEISVRLSLFAFPDQSGRLIDPNSTDTVTYLYDGQTIAGITDMPPAFVGIPYEMQLFANGGSGRGYEFFIPSSEGDNSEPALAEYGQGVNAQWGYVELPPGLSMSEDGLISGTPTVNAANTVYTFTVFAEDDCCNLQDHTGSQTFNLTVYDPATISRQWDISTVDEINNSGEHTSLAVINGQPAVAYWADQDKVGEPTGLYYSRFNGSSWQTQLVAGDTIQPNPPYNSSSPSQLGKMSLAEVGGQPAIAYSSFENGDLALRYARYNGSSWENEIVDNLGGWDASLAVVDGQPAIAYDWEVSLRDEYVKFARQNGAAWERTTIAEFGFNAALAVMDNQPVIAWQGRSIDEGVQYARFDGTNWQVETIQDSRSGLNGVGASIASINGLPGIASYKQIGRGADNNVSLNYAWFNGATWQITGVEALASPYLTTHSTSLAMIGGQPAISYFDFVPGQWSGIKFAQFDGTGWTTEFVDPDEDYSTAPSLMEINGQPAVSYFAINSGEVRFATVESLLPNLGGVTLSQANGTVTAGNKATLTWSHQASADRYQVDVYSTSAQVYSSEVYADTACVNGSCTVDVPINYAVGAYTAYIKARSGGLSGAWTQSAFTVVPANPQLTNPNSRFDPADTIEVTFNLSDGAYFTVADIYWPNGGYNRQVIEAPQCPNGVCTLSIPSYGLWGEYQVWMVSGFWPYWSDWSGSTFRVGAADTVLTSPTGSIPMTNTIPMTFNMPAGAYFAVVDVYYPNGGYLREVVEVPNCPGGVCTVPIESYGISGEYGVWIVPGWGSQFGEWAGSSFTVDAADLPTLDILGSAVEPLPQLDTSQVEAAVEGPND